MSVTPKGFGREIDLEYEIPEELRIKPIAIKVMRGVFLLFIYGLWLSIIVLIIEQVYFILFTIVLYLNDK